MAIGAVIIKHKLCLSDRETVAQIQENPYLLQWEMYQNKSRRCDHRIVSISQSLSQVAER